MKNKDIRARIARNGLRYWQVAEAVGVNATTLCVWLRQELQGERLARVTAAIDRLTGGNDDERTTLN